MATVDKFQLTASLVKAFFDAYASGIIDCNVSDAREKGQPQVVKRVMLDHYEHIFPAFHEQMTMALAVMNFSYEEANAFFTQQKKKNPTLEELLRRVCVSDELYQALVEEYKRNFGELLAGRHSSVAQFLRSYTHGENPEPIDSDIAIRLVTRMALRAYARGIRAANTGKVTLHQPTLYRLLAEGMWTLQLARDLPTHIKAHSFSELMLRICGSTHNFNVLNETMGDVYAELVEEDGIIAADDQSN